MVEGMIIRMAQSGQIPGRLDDEQLVQLLESLNQQMPKSNSTVKFDRRRAAMDSSDDEDYGLWDWRNENENRDFVFFTSLKTFFSFGCLRILLSFKYIYSFNHFRYVFLIN